MSAHDNLKTMHKYFDLLFGQELDEMLSMFTEDVDWFIVPTGTRIKGKHDLRLLAEDHWSASPDRTKKLINVFATDDYACMEYVSSGTLERPADFKTLQVAATGKTYELQVCFVFHFDSNGLIDTIREYFDMATVQRFAPVTEKGSE